MGAAGYGTVYKGHPPEGGEGGFKIVDENGHGGGESGCPLFRNFQNIIIQNPFVIKVELLAFMGENGEMINGETNVFKFSSSTKRI